MEPKPIDAWAELEARVRPYYEVGDPSHDIAHVERVARSCHRIGVELAADLDVLMPAAYLHDVVNVPKNSPDRADASRRAAALAREILGEFRGFDQTLIARIMTAIEEHSYSRGLAPSSLESAILQDADRLDALGAIGTMRTVTCGARMGCAYYAPEEPLPRVRALDDRRFTVDHFFAKLLKLEATMNTAPAKREASRRTAFMLGFLDQLASET